MAPASLMSAYSTAARVEPNFMVLTVESLIFTGSGYSEAIFRSNGWVRYAWARVPGVYGPVGTLCGAESYGVIVLAVSVRITVRRLSSLQFWLDREKRSSQ